MYSFYQSDNLEIALTGGIYWMQTEFKIAAAGFIEPVDGMASSSFQKNYEDKTSMNAPLPLFGISLMYQITPDWNLNLAARYLSVEVGDYDGRITSFDLGTDYFFTDHFGAGLSIGTFDIEIKADRSSFAGEFSLSYRGVQIYLTYKR
ncbi:MAG: hypothetical protein VB957_02755 [Pseudomonadales bacterium]